MATDEHGPLDRAIPAATATKGRTKAAYTHDEEIPMSTAKPAVMMMKPRPTTCRVPIFVANLGTSGARITRPTVAGVWPDLPRVRSFPTSPGSWK